ncbi:hypothetical protein ACS0TY_015201 [Phlomoides rotata]
METLRTDLEASLEEKKEDLILEQPVRDESHRAAYFCVVGRFLTDQTINFTAMKNMLADIWKPVKGVTIKNIGERRYLFEFYHKFDVLRVMNDPVTAASFIARGVCATCPLSTLPLWVQVYDQSNSIGAWRNYIRVRVNIDVSLPLKHFKSIRSGEGSLFWITCGRGWDISLRAPERRLGSGLSSRWLTKGQQQEHGNVGGGSVDTANVGVHGDNGTLEWDQSQLW